MKQKDAASNNIPRGVVYEWHHYREYIILPGPINTLILCEHNWHVKYTLRLIFSLFRSWYQRTYPPMNPAEIIIVFLMLKNVVRNYGYITMIRVFLLFCQRYTKCEYITFKPLRRQGTSIFGTLVCNIRTHKPILISRLY